MITQSVILTSLLTLAAPLLGEQLDSNLRPLLSQEKISSKLKSTAQQITADYQGKDLVVVLVMKGALCIGADLIREIDLPVDLQYVQCSSYGAGGTQRGALQIIGIDRLNIQNRDVLVVDDIFDSGSTMQALVDALGQKEPNSIKTCVLLEKNAHHTTDLRPDYALFQIEDLFVVGYGLDYKEQYRGLPGVFVYEEKR